MVFGNLWNKAKTKFGQLVNHAKTGIQKFGDILAKGKEVHQKLNSVPWVKEELDKKVNPELEKLAQKGYYQKASDLVNKAGDINNIVQTI